MKKRIFALLMALCMVFGMTSVALAADESTPITLGQSVQTSIEEGDSVGKVYSYTIPEVEGTYQFTVDVTAATEGKYWQVDLKNTTHQEYQSGQAIVDDWGTEVKTASVKGVAGDVIQVTVKPYGIYDNGFVYNEVDVTWTTSGKVVGTQSSPEDVAIVDNYGNFLGGDATVATGSEGYYYTFSAPMDGNLGIYINEYNCTPDSLDKLNADIILTNKRTGVSASYKAGTVKVAVQGMMGAQTYSVVQVPVLTDDEIVMQVKSGATTVQSATVSWSAVVTGEPGTQMSPRPLTTDEIQKNAIVIEVPAGGTYHFVGDYTLEGYDITVSGEEYELSFFGNEPVDVPENGIYEAPIQLMRGNLAFTISNTSEEKQEYTVYVTAPLGSESNPEPIVIGEGEETGSGTYEFTYDEANYGGKYKHFFKYVATQDGYVRVTVSADDGSERPVYSEWNDEIGEYEDITVTGEVWQYVAYNDVEGGDYTTDFSKVTETGDTVVNGQLIKVAKGDVVVIALQAMDAETGLWVDSAVTVEVEDGIASDAGSEEKALDAINNAAAGDVVEVVLYDKDSNVTSVISKEVLEALKGKDVDVLFANEYYGWVINGKDIENADDIDLTVEFDTNNIPEALAEKAAGDADWGIISLADNDDFGLIACLVLNFGMDYEEEVFSLYYYNEDGNLECVQTSEVIDGILAFAFTHASDYLLVQGEATVGAVVEPDVATTPNTTPDTTDKAPIEAPKTGDSANFALWVAVLGLGVVAMAGSVVMKKREF